MEQELIVLALGYHHEAQSQYHGVSAGAGVLNKVPQAPPAQQDLFAITRLDPMLHILDTALKQPTFPERAKVENAARLCQRFGLVLHWCRRNRMILTQSVQTQTLAYRCEQLFTHYIQAASGMSVNELYASLSEHQILLEAVEKYLIETSNIPRFLHILQQDALPCMKLLFSDWLAVQHRQWSNWIIYSILPENHTDFWIVEQDSPQASNIWDSYVLVESKLPSFIPTALAEKVLFLGKAVKLLTEDGMINGEERTKMHSKVRGIFYKAQPPTGSVAKPSRAPASAAAATSPQEDPIVDPSDPKHPSGTTEAGDSTAGPAVAQFKALEATVEIDELHDEVAKKMYELTIKRNKFHQHLQIFRQLFLVQNGEFFHAFLEGTDSYRKQSSSAAQHDMNAKFKALGRQLLSEAVIDMALFKKLKLQFAPEAAQSKDSGVAHFLLTDSRFSLQIEYPIDGPIALIFTESVLVQYHSLFQFLLVIRQVQRNLHQLWAKMRHIIEKKARPFWALRERMAYLVDNLAMYALVDVIATQCELLDRRIKETNSFEQVKAFHDEFLDTVTKQCLVAANQHTLKTVLFNLFMLIDKFCAVALEQNVAFEDSQLAIVEKEFTRHTSLLLTLLSATKLGTLNLSKLLVLLDYNHFFSKSVASPSTAN